MRKLSLVLILLAAVATAVPQEALAIGRAQYIQTTAGRGSFPLVGPRGAAPIYVDAADWPGVIRAVS